MVVILCMRGGESEKCNVVSCVHVTEGDAMYRLRDEEDFHTGLKQRQWGGYGNLDSRRQPLERIACPSVWACDFFTSTMRECIKGGLKGFNSVKRRGGYQVIGGWRRWEVEPSAPDVLAVSTVDVVRAMGNRMHARAACPQSYALRGSEGMPSSVASHPRTVNVTC
ncbi:hypothetical protein TcWFU_007318 [Taenia crassiceps]|uniref:Uncharacterized protein n=1 Tax=Taenia crassiceps TaxID=6207 RepID=A0ABR4QC10_9CEST